MISSFAIVKYDSNEEKAVRMLYVISDMHGYSHGRFHALLDHAGFAEDDFLYIL